MNSEDSYWVLAPDPGGPKVSKLNKQVKSSSETIKTATDYYHAVINNDPDSSKGTVLSTYSGNNKILTVNDSLLSISKLVEDESESLVLSDPTKFSYKINIEGFTGEHTAIKIRWDEIAKTWFRCILAIRAITDKSGLLHCAVNSKDLAIYPFQGINNYIYVKDEDTVIGAATIYNSPENSNSILPEIGSRSWNKDHSIETFSTPDIYLIPVEDYEQSIKKTGSWSFGEGNGYTRLSNFPIATMSVSEKDPKNNVVGITSDYSIKTVYSTTSLDFGDSRDEEANTAVCELSSGEGLLINGIGKKVHYEITEVLKDQQVDLGWKFRSVNGHSQSNFTGDPCYIIDDFDHKYSILGTTNNLETEANFINTTRDIRNELYVEKMHRLDGQSGFHTDDNKLYQGQEVTYQLMIRNGGEPINNITLVDPLPEQMSYIIDSSSGKYSSDQKEVASPKIENNTLTWNIDRLEKDEYIVITFKAKVDQVDKETWWINHAYIILDDQQVIKPETIDLVDLIANDDDLVEQKLIESDLKNLGEIGIAENAVKNYSAKAKGGSVYSHTAQVREYVNPDSGENDLNTEAIDHKDAAALSAEPYQSMIEQAVSSSVTTQSGGSFDLEDNTSTSSSLTSSVGSLPTTGVPRTMTVIMMIGIAAGGCLTEVIYRVMKERDREDNSRRFH